MKNKESRIWLGILHFALSILHFAFTVLVAISFAGVIGTSSVCLASEHPAEHAAPEAAVETGSGPETRAVSLGDYRIRSYYPVDAQKSTVRFTLYAAVKNGDLAQTQRLVEARKEKLRDQVITATRLAPLAVFQEPDLAAFRRRVLVRLRRAVPGLEISDLYISDFDLAIKSL